MYVPPSHKPVQSYLEGLSGVIKFEEPMSQHTSWRVGGPAEVFYVPEDKVALVQMMCQVPGNIDVHWIGLGSNLLVRDKGVRGVVVCASRGLGLIEAVDEHTIYAQAGTPSAKVARMASRMNLTGAEFLAGIPGTFGGALAMNAGAFGGETWNIVSRVELISRDGDVRWIDADEVETGYRQVGLPERYWFLGGEIKLKPAPKKDGFTRIKELLSMRGNSQPIQTANAGSVFKNPEGEHAAKLLDAAGMKGERIGDAEVSTKHANFIINHGQAMSRDIEALIDLGQRRVWDQFGVRLEPEVRILGDSE